MVKGWVEEERDGRARPTDQPRDYEVEHHGNYVAELSVPRPVAYVIPPGDGFRSAVETLQRHGIEVEELREDLEMQVGVYRVDTVTKAVRPFQGHETLTVDATERIETRSIPAGSLVVRTAQKLGSLAVCLLEPESSDGLTTWNFFDSSLEVEKDFPIVRVPASTPMLTLPAAAPPEDRPKEKKRLTFELLYESDERINLGGSPTSAQRWIDDDHFVQTKDGKSWKVHARSGRAEPMDADLKGIETALAALPTIGAKQAGSLAERHGRSTSADREGFFFDHENDLYYCRYDGTAAARLTSTPQREEYPSFSPSGEFVAFLRDNDLWVVDVDTQHERALTSGGTDRVRNGKAGWVYFEELYNRSWKLYWWSPDSARIAYIRVDSTPEKPFTIVNNVPTDQVVEVTPFPRPGEPNPRASVHVVSVAGGEPAGADLSGYDAEAMLVTGVGWWPDSSSFYAFVQNRTQTWLDMVSFPAGGGGGTKLFRETTGAWVDTPAAPEFLKDGSFLILSERSGFKHLYHYEKDGSLRTQVTNGEWDVRSVSKVVADAGAVFFLGTKDSSIATNCYRIGIDGSGLTRVTPERGVHQVNVSPGGKLLVDSWSTLETPTCVALRDATDGSLVRTMDTNPVRALDDYVLVKPELIQIPTSDGFVLEGHLHLPPGLDESTKHPVWFQTYAGPQSPTVTDAWQGGRPWDQMLAQAGFVVFRSDPRSASGKGARSAWTAYKQLGVPELADIETAIKWLSQKPYVDPARVGMAGHSYGGFMTAFALTHSTLFAAGIAGAPVTDWKDYDTIYTERFMLTPQENPDGYEKTSVVKAAEKLHGRLLLAHGMMDDNVHLANNTKLVHALQRANKPFELMLYPEARHGIGGKHYQRLQYDFIVRTLGGPVGAPFDSLGNRPVEAQGP
jgi:dipeptidyl aminopeptidase/acylaminoacyl peptidase